MSTDPGHIRNLRFCGLKYREITAITGISASVAARIVHEPEWPKLVTRIEADGSAWLVRYD